MNIKITERQRSQLERLAGKNTLTTAVIGLLGGPLAYAYMRQWRWLAVNLITFNYFLSGVILVPLHITAMIHGARWQLEKLQEGGEDQVQVDDESSSLTERMGAWYGQTMLKKDIGLS